MLIVMRVIAQALLTAYCGFVALWFLCNRLFQDAFWLPVVLDKFAEYFLLPSLLIFLLSLFLGNARLSVLTLIPMGIAAYFYLPLYFPLKQNISETQAGFSNTLLRVGTYNIWNHNKNLDSVVTIINESQADVIAIQELTEEQKPEFISLMQKTYPHYHVSRPVYGGTTALFAKKPLNKIQELDFNIDRPAILADVNVGDVIVTVVSAHLNPSFWAYNNKPLLQIPGNYYQYIKDQNSQAQMIIDASMARTESSAVILACDCNSQETASTNRLLGRFFSESLRYLGWQKGWPKEKMLRFERNLRHIDYVWFHGSTEPVSVYRGKETAGSDHAPVLADFKLHANRQP